MVANRSDESGVYALVAIADFTSAVCFLASVTYHLLMPAMTTQHAYDRLIKFDVWGVWLVNLGAGLSLTYLLFPCVHGSGAYRSGLRAALVAVPIGGSFVWVAFLAKTPASRASSFAICWLVRLSSIFLTGLLGLSPWPGSTWYVHMGAEVAPAVGAVMNVRRWPERNAPGKWDYFNSHTLMHVAVAIGMLSQHYLGLHRAALILEQPDIAQCARKEWGQVFADNAARVAESLLTLRNAP